MAEAVGLLGRLQEAAETGTRTGSVIEILVLEALAAAGGGDGASALVALEQALTAAEPEGYVRLFVDEGHAMKALLWEASRRGITTGYISELLAAWERPSVRPAKTQGLVVALSDRELEVLRLRLGRHGIESWLMGSRQVGRYAARSQEERGVWLVARPG